MTIRSCNVEHFERYSSLYIVKAFLCWKGIANQKLERHFVRVSNDAFMFMILDFPCNVIWKVQNYLIFVGNHIQIILTVITNNLQQ